MRNLGSPSVSIASGFTSHLLRYTAVDVGGILRLAQNVPQITMDSSLLTAVNRQCQPIGPNDFESFGLAFAIASGMDLSTVVEFEIEEGHLTTLGFPDSWEYTLWSYNIPFFPAPGSNETACFVLSDGST